ncbi:hypothetical protein QT381_15595 [Galbitalea sp. SE-J8]|uniref:hypothetical protein n=1 Tax=Galbitalea sp. SE-J8 TaxID=3054952 RepID=UPI00259CBDC5|nr:hypothetical protein [Galbitalea sp. SE-J8]MDM4764423.1 hypothetical protein [Galbitalea sp. SE-J8]
MGSASWAGTRRLFDQAFFTRILIGDDGEIVGELNEPFEIVRDAAEVVPLNVV